MAVIKCISNDVARDRKRSAEPPPPVGPDGKPIDTDKYEAMVFNGEELVPQSSLTGTSCASMLICQMLSKSACHRPGDWRAAEKWRVKNIHGGGRWFELGPQPRRLGAPRRTTSNPSPSSKRMGEFCSMLTTCRDHLLLRSTAKQLLLLSPSCVHLA